jgi:beta-lysine 5,6-aminomutase beta subunit
MDFYEINDYIRDNIGRKITVVAACTGTDAHTVGIDAIVNMKGYNGEYGLERYPWIDAYNLGSQVENTFLVAEARRLKADAILVSQVVTQRDVHIPNLTQLVELLEAEGMRSSVVLVAGGPRISHQLALELGYDAGFGSGTTPRQVASYIAREMVSRKLV